MPEDDRNSAAPEGGSGGLSELDLAIREAEASGGDPIERYEPRFEPLEAMSCRSIAEMDDGQLEAYIGRYQDLVHEAERNLETRKAKLNASKLEREERSASRREKKKAASVRPGPPKMDLAEAVDKLAAGAPRQLPLLVEEPAAKPSLVEAWLKRKDGKA